MSADRPLKPKQPDRSSKRRLLPYFLAAILIHLTVLLYSVHEEYHWQALPMGVMSLTLDKPASAPPPQTLPDASKPQRLPHPPARHDKVLAMPTQKANHAAPVAPVSASSESPSPPRPSINPPAPTMAAGVTSASPIIAPASTTSPARFDAAYLLNPKPDYPAISRRLGEEGKVLLKVRVTAQGLPASIDIEKTSGFERLDEAARRVVARWRFVPAKQGDQPVDAWIIVPIAFRLEG